MNKTTLKKRTKTIKKKVGPITPKSPMPTNQMRTIQQKNQRETNTPNPSLQEQVKLQTMMTKRDIF